MLLRGFMYVTVVTGMIAITQIDMNGSFDDNLRRYCAVILITGYFEKIFKN
jgi:hypothetical protein